MGFTEVIEFEVKRYQKRGLFFITLALGLFFGMFYGFFSMCRIYWPMLLELKEDRLMLSIYVSKIYNLIYILILNIIYGLIYYLEIPFLEKYKVVKKPWPWKSTDSGIRKQWWSLYYSTI
jgi:hypothetical protein